METALKEMLSESGFTWQRRWFIYNSLLRAISALKKHQNETAQQYMNDIRR